MALVLQKIKETKSYITYQYCYDNWLCFRVYISDKKIFPGRPWSYKTGETLIYKQYEWLPEIYRKACAETARLHKKYISRQNSQLELAL